MGQWTYSTNTLSFRVFNTKKRQQTKLSLLTVYMMALERKSLSWYQYTWSIWFFRHGFNSFRKKRVFILPSMQLNNSLIPFINFTANWLFWHPYQYEHVRYIARTWLHSQFSSVNILHRRIFAISKLLHLCQY